ncbi:hypothetical protein EPUS_03412 [Endocarpon pusillum Z07020]|uniref:Uncharacterized protein n=1 Tax=Endocarpon pusillum (strain Z07020 / HMAS-L-300199) TaxID=1263415 RepID=U1G9R0_ENDPU|nr:uncharacterized protein EPUS_03412 [Endocarpon pusillum Z07020]ERF74222.1 hypothetical protein EPUS_03412 [Endocarpon pusillum Z07020]
MSPMQAVVAAAPRPPPPPSGRAHHVRIESPISPRRRDHVPQPPSLTTSLSGLQLQGGGLFGAMSTPTTSLSSPFSQVNPSPYTPYTSSPGGALRGTSPMASRQSGGYTSAYNPQEWVPVVRSPQVGAASLSHVQQQGGHTRQQQQSDDSAAPPPYSPPRRQDPRSRAGSSLVISPAETASPVQSPYNTPVSATTGVPADVAYATQQARSRPASMIYSSGTGSNAWPSALPPPPPLINRAVRSSSSTAVGRTDATVTIPSVDSQGKSVASPVPARPLASPQQDSESTPFFGAQVNTAETLLLPPSSRRAVSTSAIGLGVSSRTSSRSASKSPTRHTTWEPGMPLPGPPPGPPPSSSRSQSASGASDRFSRHLLTPANRPKTRQAPQTGTVLGPVPPTPAGWIDTMGLENDSATSSSRPSSSITFSPVEISNCATPSSSRSDTTSMFFPANTKRAPSAKGIRERRSESRSARDCQADEANAIGPSTNPWAEAKVDVTPADLTLPAGGSGLSRRRTITKSTPRTRRSSRSATMDEQVHGSTLPDLHVDSATGSSRNTPRPGSGRPQMSIDGSSPTPPFSPTDGLSSPRLVRNTAGSLPPRSLPTPPLQQARSPKSSLIPPSNLQIRPISHILHMPNEVAGIPAPLSPRRPSSARSNTTRTIHLDHDSFVRDCLDRTKTFLEKEQYAESDEDRLQLFSEYILAESRVRRRRYAAVFPSFDPRQTRDRLFELNIHAPRRSSGLQETTAASPIEPSSPHSRNECPEGRPEPTRPDQGRPDSMWWSGYQPALSPIVSMSMNDEQSSRGRAPSRWWESQTGSEVGGGTRRVERSKRESKYMGLPLHEVQLAMEGEDFHDPEPSQIGYGENEYPPEKMGLHEIEPSTTPGMPPPLPSPCAALDVSRLVTLPPPYPRHYPAVQNQHPDLLSYRTLVRTVSDLTELTSRRTRYKASIEALSKDNQARIAENRRNFRTNIQAQIQEGSISYAEAAEAEAAMKSEEQAAEKSRVQAEFDSFQDVVLNPLHDLLNDRISKTTHHITELQSQLLSDAQLHNPNATQSAGDERPELLEQLTQLKWLFEAREQLHREVFGLLTERNAKYQTIVTLPYQQSGNKDKIRETTVFFTRDTQDRTTAFEAAVLKRHESFLSVIEENVLRGVEAQLSAFWDIAPGLLAICLKIPERNPQQQQQDRHATPTMAAVDGVGGGGGQGWSGIQIPREEIQENPSYRQFPMQYLYSLLRHAERSAYQFIESQVNLLCLLHEVRTGVMVARVRVAEVGQLAGRTDEDAAAALFEEQVKRQAQERREVEERALTADLKDRVATVEGQWTEALGSAIAGTRERVRAWLVEEGGWDKELLEDVE